MTSPAERLPSRLSRLLDLFAYPLRASHYLELINPLWATHLLQARVVDIWDETRDSRTLTLKPGWHWRGHRAGQHIRVGVTVDGRHFTRTYSLSSAPERRDGRFSITVKAIAGGRISHHLVRRVKLGEYLPIGLPQGDFFLPDAQPVRALFITAGSGITPVMSMLRSRQAQGRVPNAVHIHYAPHELDVIFGSELQAFDAAEPLYRLETIHTHEYGADKQTKGYFSLAQIDRLCPDWREREIYACGPAGLITAIEAVVADADRSLHLHIERFRADFAHTPVQAGSAQIRFQRSGISVAGDAVTPLLRSAEDAGLNPPHGCRMGICHTCNTTLLAGEVRDLRSGTVIREAGSTVQICVCAPAGDCELAL